MTETVSAASAQIMPAQVTLEIPCLAEYVGIARLAVLGIANRMDFTYDEIEDVRLAVGEACTHAIERANAAFQSQAEPQLLRIKSFIDSEALVIEVHDSVPPGTAGVSSALHDEDGLDKQGLGEALMEILVDKVEVDAAPSGTVVRLTKYAPQR